MRRRSILLDCDPGHDDAFAIILAAYSEGINLLGITTVSGNQTVDKTTVNAIRILYIGGLLEKNIPVAKGASYPLIYSSFQGDQDKTLKDSHHSNHIHGESGMDGINGTEIPPDIKYPLHKKPACLFMADLIAKHYNGVPITIVCVGPLTNVALLLSIFPELRSKISVVLMGGSFHGGNATPAAEFNMAYDPIAARIVFESGIPITIVPLDLTLQVRVTDDVIERILSMSSSFSRSMLGLLNFYRSTYQRIYGFSHPPLHDPCAVAYVIDPSKFEVRHIHVDIETSSPLCMGQTVGDFHERNRSLQKNAFITMNVNVEWFWNTMKALKLNLTVTEISSGLHKFLQTSVDILSHNLSCLKTNSCSNSHMNDAIWPPNRMDLPLIDLQEFLHGDIREPSIRDNCFFVTNAFNKYGAILVRDPRLAEDVDRFLDLLERYFEQPTELKIRDCRPEVHYQVGLTPELTEWPRDNSEEEENLAPKHKPTPFDGPDKKWRFQWRIGPRRRFSKFPELLADPVIPQNFPEWSTTMNNWGEKLLATVETVSEMLSIGFGLPSNTFPELIRYGTHLLSPTGSDLNIYGEQVGTVLAGFHYDISYLTIHGRSRFPGLYLWTSEGVRLPCLVPPGCLLVQAGAQLEYLTGGYIKRGFHEVIVSEETRRVVEEKKRRAESLWRVSSTMFTHVEPDKILRPLVNLGSPQMDEYPPIHAGEQVEEELEAIQLMRFKYP
eukprot:jgi/Galph1/5920/GphlegSOOS_G4608.1